jgi:hypothetical protein
VPPLRRVFGCGNALAKSLVVVEQGQEEQNLAWVIRGELEVRILGRGVSPSWASASAFSTGARRPSPTKLTTKPATIDTTAINAMVT